MFLFLDTLNTQVHEVTKHTPYELAFGQPPRSLVILDPSFRGKLDEEDLVGHEENSPEQNKDNGHDESPERQEGSGDDNDGHAGLEQNEENSHDNGNPAGEDSDEDESGDHV